MFRYISGKNLRESDTSFFLCGDNYCGNPIISRLAIYSLNHHSNFLESYDSPEGHSRNVPRYPYQLVCPCTVHRLLHCHVRATGAAIRVVHGHDSHEAMWHGVLCASSLVFSTRWLSGSCRETTTFADQKGEKGVAHSAVCKHHPPTTPR